MALRATPFYQLASPADVSLELTARASTGRIPRPPRPGKYTPNHCQRPVSSHCESHFKATRPARNENTIPTRPGAARCAISPCGSAVMPGFGLNKRQASARRQAVSARRQARMKTALRHLPGDTRKQGPWRSSRRNARSREKAGKAPGRCRWSAIGRFAPRHSTPGLCLVPLRHARARRPGSKCPPPRARRQ